MVKNKKPSSLKNKYACLIQIILLLFIILIFTQYKPLLLILVFEIVELIKVLIKQKTKQFPIDFVFVFGITASYFYSPIIGFVIFFLGVHNRKLMKTIKSRHITKGVRHLTLFLIVSLLRSFPFFSAAVLMLMINYAFKYLIGILFLSENVFDKALYHITNFIGSTVLFQIISILYQNLRFLRP